jgi:hypothetical protein
MQPNSGCLNTGGAARSVRKRRGRLGLAILKSPSFDLLVRSEKAKRTSLLVIAFEPCGETSGTSKARQMLEHAIEKSRGGVFLKLTPEQHARLKRP